jgi:hypothetical protein
MSLFMFIVVFFKCTLFVTLSKIEILQAIDYSFFKYGLFVVVK